MHASVGGWFSGVLPGCPPELALCPRCARAVRKRPLCPCPFFRSCAISTPPPPLQAKHRPGFLVTDLSRGLHKFPNGKPNPIAVVNTVDKTPAPQALLPGEEAEPAGRALMEDEDTECFVYITANRRDVAVPEPPPARPEDSTPAAIKKLNLGTMPYVGSNRLCTPYDVVYEVRPLQHAALEGGGGGYPPPLQGAQPTPLWDIRFLPTRSAFTFFQNFLNFWSNAPKCRHLGGGGGMCMLFEICEKMPFQKCMGWGGGVGGHSFAHRAVNERTHRAQAMLQGSLIIPNPIRCHRCPFPQVSTRAGTLLGHTSPCL